MTRSAGGAWPGSSAGDRPLAYWREAGEADHLVFGQVAADGALGNAGLERLVDQPSGPAGVAEGLLAAGHELTEGQFLHDLVAMPAVLYGYGRIWCWVRVGWCLPDQLDLPHADPAVAPILLLHPRSGRGQASWELVGEVIHGDVEVRVGTPAQLAGPVEHLFGAHLEDHVRVGAHPHAGRCHLA